MATQGSDTSLGAQLRDARLRAGLSLRALAERIERAPSYLNDIEHNRRVPSESVIKQLCAVLGLNEDRLLAAAGRVGEGAAQYLKSNPTAGVLLRTASGAGLGEHELEKTLEYMERLIQDRDDRSERRAGQAGEG